MKLTSRMLRRIIKEEMTKLNNRQRLSEDTVTNPVQITHEYLNRIIKEEYEAFQNQQHLAEARLRQRRITASRKRRLNRR
jgi:hypothetical protein